MGHVTQINNEYTNKKKNRQKNENEGEKKRTENIFQSQKVKLNNLTYNAYMHLQSHMNINNNNNSIIIIIQSFNHLLKHHIHAFVHALIEHVYSYMNSHYNNSLHT